MGGGRPARRRTRSWLRPFDLLVAIVLVGGGLVVALLVHRQASRDEAARVSMQFLETFSDRQQLLQRELYRMGEELHQMASLFEMQAGVSREHFAAFAREVVSIFPQIHACEWAPREEPGRDDLEGRARRSGERAYRAALPEPSGESTAGPSSPTPFRVMYAEPQDPNGPVLGFDLAPERVRAATVARALETRRVTVSEPFTLPQQNVKAVLAVLAVTIRSPGSATAAEPPAHGVVIMVIGAQDLLDGLRLRAPAGSARYHLAASGANGAPIPLAASPGWEESAASPAEWERPLEIGGQRWILAAHPTETFLAEHRTYQPVLLAASAFVFWCSAIGLILLGSKRSHDSARRERDRIVGAAMTGLTEGVVVADADGRFVFFNEAAERILGLGLAEMSPSEWSERYGCFYPDGVTPFPSADLPLARALRGERSEEVEVFIRNDKAVEGAWISISGAPLPTVAGAPGGGVVTFRDISERRKTQAALQRSNEERAQQEQLVRRLSSAVEQTADSVFITNREGIIEYVNPGFETMTGYARAEVVGQTPRVLKSGRYRPGHYRKLWATILAGQVYRATNINRRKNGEEFQAQQTITPMFDAQGALTHFVSVVKDVTDQLRQQKRELEMEYAARVQQQLYPKQAPKLDDFDLAGSVFPASETGGDYFDYVVMDDGCLAVAIGDVCGHGPASALIMAETRAFVRSLAGTCSDPAAILTRMNTLLLEHLADERQYVTLLLARLDIDAGRVSYASAGHTDGFVLNESGDVRAALSSTGIPLGMFPDITYDRRDDVRLEAGDMVVLLTDGITEAESPTGRVFSAQDVIEVVRAHRAESVEAIVQHVRAAVYAFAESQALPDDLTIVVGRARR